MLLTFIGAVMVGISAGGIVSMLFRFILRRPTPRSAMPIAAGLSVLIFLAYLEYNWYDANRARLPTSTIVVETTEFSNVLQPWTLIWPRVNGYLAIDADDTAQVSSEPDVRATPLYNIRRYVGTREFRLIVNCETNEIIGVPVVEGEADMQGDDTRVFPNTGSFETVRNAMCASA